MVSLKFVQIYKRYTIVFTCLFHSPELEKMYYFSRLAVELNEPEPLVAPTDSRHRPDQRLMENGTASLYSMHAAHAMLVFLFSSWFVYTYMLILRPFFREVTNRHF